MTAQQNGNEADLAPRERIVQHIEETRWQQGMLDACLATRGISHAVPKDLGGKLMAVGQTVGGMMASDGVVKRGHGWRCFREHRNYHQ